MPARATPLDRGGLEILDEDTCLRLLAGVPVGRVAFDVQDRVVILPVAHVIDGRDVVFRTGPGSKLGAAAARNPVAFEADAIEPATRSGWSVIVQGRADLVTDGQERERFLGGELNPWPDAVGRGEVVRVQTQRLTGRRLPGDGAPEERVTMAPPPFAVRHLEPLDAPTCRRLLAESQVGRVGFVLHGVPLILPVNHALDGRDVVFRTARGSKLDVAQQHAGGPASFQADSYDPDTRTGWSVLLSGRMHPVLDQMETHRLDRLGLDPWADAIARSRWLRIVPARVTGRRLVLGGVPGWPSRH